MIDVKEVVDKWLRYISALTLISIFLGNFYEFLYFHAFDVNIYDFISTSDVISLFLPTIYATIVLISVLLILIVFPMSLLMPRLKRSLGNHFFTVILSACFILSIIGNIIVGLVSYKHSYITNNYLNFIGSAIRTLGAVLVVLVLIHRTGVKLDFNDKIINITLGVFSAMIIISHLAEFTSSRDKIEKAGDAVYKFTTKDWQYVTSDSVKYIGSTRQNIFIFAKSTTEDETIILNKADLIKPITISYPHRIPFPLDPPK